jgi:hypothetical protein
VTSFTSICQPETGRRVEHLEHVELSPSTVGLLVVVALLAGFASLAVSVVALSGQRKVRGPISLLDGQPRRRADPARAAHRRGPGAARRRPALERYADELRELARGAVSRVGTVRYDAFEDMGGRLSFSSALLDERGDGVVVTAINGRTDTRVYAKPVRRSQPAQPVREEVAAIETARCPSRASRAEAAAAARRSRRRDRRRLMRAAR